MTYPPYLMARNFKFIRFLGASDMSLTSTSWAELFALSPWSSGAGDITLDADIGDTLVMTLTASLGSGPEVAFDFATMVSGSQVNTFSGGASFGSAQPGGASFVIDALPGPVPYTVVGGDILNGRVTVRPIYKLATSGTVHMFCSTGQNACFLTLENKGPQETV